MKKSEWVILLLGIIKSFSLIAGPCVLEDEKVRWITHDTWRNLRPNWKFLLFLKHPMTKPTGLPSTPIAVPVWKRFSDPGKIKGELNIPVLSDVHRFEEIDAATQILDVVQIPAFLCRQTDFIVEIAKKARVINVKKRTVSCAMGCGQYHRKDEKCG